MYWEINQQPHPPPPSLPFLPIILTPTTNFNSKLADNITEALPEASKAIRGGTVRAKWN